jgi:Fuc2NAc and GlcNAc transferase
VVGSLIAVLSLPFFGAAELTSAFAAAISGAAIAVAGFLDDKHHLRPSIRLGVQLVASLAFLSTVQAALSIPLPGSEVALLVAWPWSLMLVFPLVWGINLYNFMDGIDGLAGVEALTVALGAAVILLMTDDTRYVFAFATVAAATLGFLLWNWPPAKIFMGDVASGFLGFLFGAFIILTQGSALNIWAWFILLGVFIVDATITLLRRLARGDNAFAAHRSHAYQHAARRLGNHRSVTLAIGAINLFWLLPLAGLAAIYPSWGALITIMAWLPIALAAERLRAGRANEQTTT